MASSDNDAPQQQALITITDLIGVREPAVELVRAITKGIGNVFEPWQRQRNAKADLNIYNAWKNSLVDTEDLPSSFEWSIDDRAGIRLQNETRRRQLNRERVAVEAIEEYRASESKRRPGDCQKTFDDDLLNFFWRAAEEVSSPDMQSLWGRVLARQALGQSQYQLRTLDFLRTLSRSEAEDISRLAGFAVQVDCRWGTGTGILNHLGKLGRNIEDSKARQINDKIKECVGNFNYGHLGSVGFFIEDGWAYDFAVDSRVAKILLQFADKRLKISGNFLVNEAEGSAWVSLGSGFQISLVGVEILTLTKAQADPTFFDLIMQGVTSQGLSVEQE